MTDEDGNWMGKQWPGFAADGLVLHCMDLFPVKNVIFKACVGLHWCVLVCVLSHPHLVVGMCWCVHCPLSAAQA